VGELAEGLIESLLGLTPTTIYLLIAALCWAEAAFFLGFLTPGEFAVAAGGILASRGQVAFLALVGVVVVGTMAGNATGYFLGRRWGTGVLEWPPLQKLFGSPIHKAQDFMRRRGEWAIVLGRLTTPTRIMVPFLAGSSRLPYPRYVLFDLPATIVWALAWTILGFTLGESWELLQDVAGTAAFLVLILFVIAVVIRWVTARIAANQRRVLASFQLLLRFTGTRGIARRMAPFFFWLGRRLDPRFAKGLGLTLAFLALMGAAGGIGLVMSQTRAVTGLALIDFPVLEWMGQTRTDEAVQVARTGLRAFHWPGVLLIAVPLSAVLAWRVGWAAAFRVGVGLTGAGGGAYFLDRYVLEGLVPGAEYPSVPVAVAAVFMLHTTVVVGRRWGWAPSVATAGAGTFVTCTVALGTVVAGWAAPSGIALGFAMGLAWAMALELPRTLRDAAFAPEMAPESEASASPPGDADERAGPNERAEQSEQRDPDESADAEDPEPGTSDTPPDRDEDADDDGDADPKGHAPVTEGA
jgi:membrane protein DedA with SNARE-associated domain